MGEVIFNHVIDTIAFKKQLTVSVYKERNSFVLRNTFIPKHDKNNARMSTMTMEAYHAINMAFSILKTAGYFPEKTNISELEKQGKI